MSPPFRGPEGNIVKSGMEKNVPPTHSRVVEDRAPIVRKRRMSHRDRETESPAQTLYNTRTYESLRQDSTKSRKRTLESDTEDFDVKRRIREPQSASMYSRSERVIPAEYSDYEV